MPFWSKRSQAIASAFHELVSNATQTFEVAFHEAAGPEAGGGREGSDLRLFTYISPQFALASYPQPVGTLRGYVTRGHPLPARFEGGARDGMHFIFTLSSVPPEETRVGTWGQTVIGTYHVHVRAKSVPVEAAVPPQANAVIAVMKASGAKSYAYEKLPTHARESIYPKPAPGSRWIYAEVSAPALYKLVGARDGHANFGDYHRAYMDRRGRGRTHSGWAVVLDTAGTKVISDGWEEFHDWIDQGARKIPCVAPHPAKVGAASADPYAGARPPSGRKPPGPPGLTAPAPAPAAPAKSPRAPVRRPTPVAAPAPRPSRPGVRSPAPTTPAPAPITAPPAVPKTGIAADLPREGTCAIHSMAFALGVSPNDVWAKVHDLWADGGRAKAGMASRDIWRSLQRFGKGYRSRPDLFRPNGDEGRTSSFKTVITRLAKLRGPAFLVSVDAHVVCVKDGKLMDTWKTPAGSHVRDVGEVTDNVAETPLNDSRLEDLTGRYVEGRDENGTVRRGVYLNKGKVFVERTDYTGYELVALDPMRDTGKSVPVKLRTALKRAYTGKPTGGARSPLGPKVGAWVQATFRKPDETKVWAVSGIYIGGNRIIVDLSVPGKPNVGVLNIEDPKPARGKPTAAQTAFYKQLLENTRNKTEAAVPTPYYLRKADASRVVENEFYRLGPARYAKGQMQVTFPPNESRWKTTPMSLAEDCGGRWVNRTGGYIMSPRQAERFEAAVARWVAERKAAGNPVRQKEVGAALSDFCDRAVTAAPKLKWKDLPKDPRGFPVLQTLIEKGSRKTVKSMPPTAVKEALGAWQLFDHCCDLWNTKKIMGTETETYAATYALGFKLGYTAMLRGHEHVKELGRLSPEGEADLENEGYETDWWYDARHMGYTDGAAIADAQAFWLEFGQWDAPHLNIGSH